MNLFLQRQGMHGQFLSQWHMLWHSHGTTRQAFAREKAYLSCIANPNFSPASHLRALLTLQEQLLADDRLKTCS